MYHIYKKLKFITKNTFYLTTGESYFRWQFYILRTISSILVLFIYLIFFENSKKLFCRYTESVEITPLVDKPPQGIHSP